VSRVVYLPDQSPGNEIRLVAVSDRLSPPNPKPFTYGLELAERPFKISVLDVDSEQLLERESNPALLPPGWSFAERVVWNRRP
jgi:hypothetical protein